jgi:hypothetical protein
MIRSPACSIVRASMGRSPRVRRIGKQGLHVVAHAPALRENAACFPASSNFVASTIPKSWISFATTPVQPV